MACHGWLPILVYLASNVIGVPNPSPEGEEARKVLVFFIFALQLSKKKNHFFLSFPRLLYQQYVNKEYKLFRVIEQDVSYPVNNTASRYVITLVEAFDIHPNPSGAGYASIIRGGVGRRNITIHLESARNHGLKYLVLIWGHIQY
ncbi:uncharacterized protein LOC103524274 [Diaphorina citri]|uniref:Uncharacterized protein LOC103524274 n=1 Tax=Diaphorina citri TaxID=121845 RepID=A0A1S3DV15_DIACI|nr:uncharacterized protein LOC103524274 [Diaphorina citri]